MTRVQDSTRSTCCLRSKCHPTNIYRTTLPRLQHTHRQVSLKSSALFNASAESKDFPASLSVQRVEEARVPERAAGPASTSARATGDEPKGRQPPSDPVEAAVDWRMTLLCCLGPSIGGLLFGYDIGSTSGALLSLTDPVRSGTDWYDLSPLDRGEIVSLSMVGACIASLVALVAQDRLGRRRELILAACCYGLASATMAAAPNENTLLFGRLLYGIGIGLAMHGAPAYIAETVPQRVRGLALTCKEVLIVSGILLGFVASYELSGTLEGWRWLYLLSSSAAMLLGAVMLYLPESPRWSLLHGEPPVVAREALKRIRRTETRDEKAAVNRELGSIYANISRIKDDTTKVGVKALVGALYREKKFRDPLLIGCSLMFFQQVTGQPSVLYYATQIFESAGASAEAASSYTLWVGVLKIVGTVVAVMQVDKWGRRPLLLGGVFGMMLALIGLSLGTSELLDADLSSKVELASLLTYVACYQFSFGPMSWLICGEIFPLSVRGPAMALATMTNFSCNFLVSLVLPSLQQDIGMTDLYMGFASMTALALVVFYFAVPETRGKSLEEIEALFVEQDPPGGAAKPLPP